MKLNLKKELILGVSSSAMQIEGGDCNSSWNDWYRKGRIRDGSDPARSTDHWNRWKADADLMAELGVTAYRFGIEWARICPKEGRIDRKAIERYREEMTYLKEKGISLLLTIHHFANPMWFEMLGGFSKKENLRHFLEFTALAVESFGDLLEEYITINEPNVYATHSYLYGIWPPGEASFPLACKVLSNLALAHVRAYGLIHEIRAAKGFGNTKVGLAVHLRVFDPENPAHPVHRLYSGLLRRFFQTALMKACYRGRFVWPLRAPERVEKRAYSDFLAINYYSRSTISGPEDGIRPGVPINDLGWEIYPEGLARVISEALEILPRPVYVTENGTCDNQDRFRCRFLYDHLAVLASRDLPVERYYHWCFCDNFELLEGESARFGLVHVDFKTQERTVKKSGRFFREILRSGGVSEEAYDAYVRGEEYPRQ